MKYRHRQCDLSLGFFSILLSDSYLFLNSLPLFHFPNSLAYIEPYSNCNSLFMNSLCSSLWCQVSGVVCVRFGAKRTCPMLIINEIILERQSWLDICILICRNVRLACVPDTWDYSEYIDRIIES